MKFKRKPLRKISRRAKPPQFNVKAKYVSKSLHWHPEEVEWALHFAKGLAYAELYHLSFYLFRMYRKTDRSCSLHINKHKQTSFEWNICWIILFERASFRRWIFCFGRFVSVVVFTIIPWSAIKIACNGIRYSYEYCRMMLGNFHTLQVLTSKTTPHLVLFSKLIDQMFSDGEFKWGHVLDELVDLDNLQTISNQ